MIPQGLRPIVALLTMVLGLLVIVNHWIGFVESDVDVLTSHAVGDYSKNEGNTLRVEGTYYGERNYGIIDFSGARKSREMHIQIFNSDGEPVWDKTIKAQ